MTASDRLTELVKDPALWDRSNADILDAFVARRAHDSGATAHTERGRIAAQLRRYAVRHAVPIPTLRTVLTDAVLFGAVLAADQQLRGPGRVSRVTVKNTRQAFAALIAVLPPPQDVTRDALRSNLATARRATERTVGLRRIATIGEARPRRFVVPSAAEIARVVAALREALPPGHPAPDLVAFLYLTGVRLGAALALTTADLRQKPDGTAWVYVWEKARPDSRPPLRPARAGSARAGLAAAAVGRAPLGGEGTVRPGRRSPDMDHAGL